MSFKLNSPLFSTFRLDRARTDNSMLRRLSGTELDRWKTVAEEDRSSIADSNLYPKVQQNGVNTISVMLGSICCSTQRYLDKDTAPAVAEEKHQVLKENRVRVDLVVSFQSPFCTSEGFQAGLSVQFAGSMIPGNLSKKLQPWKAVRLVHPRQTPTDKQLGF